MAIIVNGLFCITYFEQKVNPESSELVKAAYGLQQANEAL